MTSLKFAESIQFDEIINENSFIFLNKKKDFGESIDWNYLGFGRLWAYNLNYFEFLHQKEMNAQRGREIIDSFIEQLAPVTLVKSCFLVINSSISGWLMLILSMRAPLLPF